MEINSIMTENNTKNVKQIELEKLRYDNNSQNVKLKTDTPIIARKNSKQLDKFNNEALIIKHIQFEKENMVISDGYDKTVDIPFDTFQKLFYVANATTIYKSQGSTFSHECSIHKLEHPIFDARLILHILTNVV